MSETGAGSRARVSVVIPVGLVDDDLPLQLEALAGQSFPEPWELVLSLNSDDPGQRTALDSALASVGGDSPFSPTVVDSSAVRSASHARNVGAAAAGGDYLLFCDGDDIADIDWLAKLVAELESAEAVGGRLEEELLAVPGQENWRPPATPGALPSFLGFPYLVSANMGVHRELFEAVGGFDTSLIRGEDIAFSWALIDRGIELRYAPDAVIHYRHRRGLWPMLKQHYLYGRGFSQLLARRGVPGQPGGATGLRALKPNSQPVDELSLVYFARRGSIAAGRVVGLVEARSGR